MTNKLLNEAHIDYNDLSLSLENLNVYELNLDKEDRKNK
jgi:hypothetical protein